MTPTLHLAYASPPSRAVLITTKALGLHVKIIEVSLDEGQKFLNFLQHTVFEEDDGFALWDSHAIMSYLVRKYARNDLLYPASAKKRAHVDQMLHYESGVIFAILRRIMRKVIYEGRSFVGQGTTVEVIEIYHFLESALKKKKWAAGNWITIADYSLFSSISTLNIVVPLDRQKFPRISAWMRRCASLPECGANKRGLKVIQEMFGSRLEEKDIHRVYFRRRHV